MPSMPTKMETPFCSAIDMSKTEERIWKECPKGGAVTQALEMPMVLPERTEGCCETRNTSTFFVALRKLPKNHGN